PLDVSKSTAEIVVSYGKQLKEFTSAGHRHQPFLDDER
ncbi:hypothetical protein F442_08024, partial [Phytophthora nicotianae P10297]